MIVDTIFRTKNFKREDLYDFSGIFSSLSNNNKSDDIKNKVVNLDSILYKLDEKLNKAYNKEKSSVVNFVRDFNSEIFKIRIDVGADYYYLLFNITSIQKIISKRNYKTEKRKNFYLKCISKNTDLENGLDYGFIDNIIDKKAHPIVLKYDFVEKGELLIDGNHRISSMPVFGVTDVHVINITECNGAMPNICMLLIKVMGLINSIIRYMKDEITSDELENILKDIDRAFKKYK